MTSGTPGERTTTRPREPVSVHPLLPIAPSRPRDAKDSASLRVDFNDLVRPRFEVMLSHGAVKRIREEIYAEAVRGWETCGHLWAHRPADDGMAVVCHASAPPADARHRPISTVMGSIRQAEAELPDFVRLTCVGHWHTHPGNDNGKPSRTDMESWADLTCRALPDFVGVIATKGPDGYGWSWPDLHAWHVHRGGSLLSGQTQAPSRQVRTCPDIVRTDPSEYCWPPYQQTDAAALTGPGSVPVSSGART